MLNNLEKVLNNNDGDQWYLLLKDEFRKYELNWRNIAANAIREISGYYDGSHYFDCNDDNFGWDEDDISDVKEQFGLMVLKKFKNSSNRIDIFSEIYNISIKLGYNGTIHEFCDMLKKSNYFLDDIYDYCVSCKY